MQETMAIYCIIVHGQPTIALLDMGANIAVIPHIF